MKKICTFALLCMLSLGLIGFQGKSALAFDSGLFGAKSVSVEETPATAVKNTVYKVPKKVCVSKNYKFKVEELETTLKDQIKTEKIDATYKISKDDYSAKYNIVGNYNVEIEVDEKVNGKSEKHLLNVAIKVVNDDKFLYAIDSKTVVLKNDVKIEKEVLMSVLKTVGVASSKADDKNEIVTNEYTGKEKTIGDYKLKLKVTEKSKATSEKEVVLKVVDAKNINGKIGTENKLKEIFTSPVFYIVLGTVVLGITAIIIIKVKKNS